MATRKAKPKASAKKFRMRPVWIYVIGIGCFIVSRIFEEQKIDWGNYIFSIIGAVLFVIAIRNYFFRKQR